jgi:hypothetical protein
MLVTLSNRLGITLDVEADVTWAASTERAHGKAELRISRASAAWNAEILDERGGFIVTVFSRFGIWRGIADRPRWEPAGVRVTVWALSRWCEIRRVGARRTFYQVPAGMIVRAAWRDGLAEILPVAAGAFLMAPPLIPVYRFERQTVLDVLTAMMDATGHAWELDARGRFHWRSRLGRYRETWHVDDGALFSELSEGELSELTAEVIETDAAGREFHAPQAGAPLWWPGQELERV